MKLEMEILKLKSKPTDDFTTNRELTLSGFNMSALETILFVAQRIISETMTTLPDNSYIIVIMACCYGRTEFIFGNAKAVVTPDILRKRIARCHNRLNKTINGQPPGRTSIIDKDIGFAIAITGCSIIKQQNILPLLLSETTRRWISPQAQSM